MPFILVCKSIYCCYHNDIWTFTYFFQQFISYIPFIGSYLLSLLNEQGFLLSDNLIKGNPFTGCLIFFGGVGSSLGKALYDLFLDKDKAFMVGDLPDKTPRRRTLLSEINKLSSLLMQDKSGEGSQNNSSQVASPGGIKSNSYSFDTLDKLIAERTKIISKTKEILQGKLDNSHLSDKQPDPKDPQPSSKVPVTDNINIVELVTHLGKIRIKHNEAVGELILCHLVILDNKHLFKEIIALADQVEKINLEFITSLDKIKPKHLNEGKMIFDLENRIYKRQAKINLEIENKLFEEMKKAEKEGRLPNGFIGAEYKKEIKNVWLREREAFMGEERKLKKEAGKIINNKG